MTHKRRNFWVHQFQTQLLARVVLYWLLTVAGIFAVLLTLMRIDAIVNRMAIPTADFTKVAAVIIVGVVFGGLFLWEALLLTHRLAGPLLRFKRTLDEIREGKEVELIHLRKGDMLVDLAEAFNSALESLREKGVVRIKTPEERSHNAPANAKYIGRLAIGASLLAAVAVAYVCWPFLVG